LGLQESDLEGKKFYRGAGCDACNNTGYKGRVGLFELMVLNNQLREAVMRNVSADDLREQARQFGMTPLRDAGMSAIHAGITSVEEVVRETVLEA
jgi:type IV pilus assembly protein PilB